MQNFLLQHVRKCYIEECQSNGLVFCRARQKEAKGYSAVKIGNRIIFISNEIPSLCEEIIEKYSEGQFFTQHQIEEYYGKTHSYISGIVRRSEIYVVNLGGIRFYVLKDIIE